MERSLPRRGETLLGGIPPEHQHAIFQPFVQLGRSLTSGREETGLGLAISRDFARPIGGEITLRSEPGARTTFTLTLPPDR